MRRPARGGGKFPAWGRIRCRGPCDVYELAMQKHSAIHREAAVRLAFFLAAASSIIALGLITLYLFMEGAPLFASYPVWDFLTGMAWYPTADPPEFGILPLIAASAAVTALSSLMAVPLGVMTAAYLAEIASPRMRSVTKPMLEMLAALPSVLMGFFGMVVIAPFLQDHFDLPTGLNLFTAALLLAFMSVPTICTVSEDSLRAVPDELRAASLALGATRWETLVRVTFPAALSGISTAVILGMSRSIGETMVTLMVAGGAAMVPASVFDPVRPMPASIAAEMAETPVGSPHYHALFAIGIVLFAFTMLFNLLADHFARKYRLEGGRNL